jgi:DNA-binding NarL/FixJ family response regulator
MEAHTMLRQALRKILEGDGGLEVVGEMGNADELFEYLDCSKPVPNMILLDLFAPTLQGVEGMRRIKLLHPKVSVLVLSMYENHEYMHEVLSNGAEGYLLKKEANTELFLAIARIREGGIYLPPLLCGKLT